MLVPGEGQSPSRKQARKREPGVQSVFTALVRSCLVTGVPHDCICLLQGLLPAHLPPTSTPGIQSDFQKFTLDHDPPPFLQDLLWLSSALR